jgi:hypothetical protein
MKLLTRKETHQVFRFEPDAFLPDSTPKEDERLGVEFSTGTG